MPSSRTTGSTAASTSRSKMEYSVCSTDTGCTACARRMVSGPASLSPKYRTLPSSIRLAHRARDVLDRHVRVDAVLVEHVEDVGLQVAQAVLGDLADVLRAAVRPVPGGLLGSKVEAELRRDHDLVAERRDRLADDLLVEARPEPVELGGVEEGDAELVRAADGRDALVPVTTRPVGHRHAHRAEADGGDLEAVLSQCASLHGRDNPRRRGCFPPSGNLQVGYRDAIHAAAYAFESALSICRAGSACSFCSAVDFGPPASTSYISR